MAKSAFYKIWNDNKVDITDMVTDLSVEESETESDLIHFRINDTEIEVMDADWLADGKKVYVLFGYLNGDISTKRVGKIKQINYLYGVKNQISVDALDLGELNQTSSRVYKKKLISEIVSEIASASGLKSSIDKTGKRYDSIPQGNKTYIQFLKELANMAGAESKEGSYYFTISGETLYFRKRKLDKKPVLKVNRIDKISFSVNQDSSKAFESMETSFTDPATGEQTTVKSEASKDQETALGKYLYNANGVQINKSDSGRNVVLQAESKEDAKRELDKKVKDSQLNAITGTLSMEGIFAVKPGDIVTLSGFARKHSGNWKVEKVEYSFNPSFLVTYTLKKNASDVKGSAKNEKANSKNSQVGATSGDEKTDVKTVKYDQNGIRK